MVKNTSLRYVIITEKGKGLKVEAYPHDVSLCVVALIKLYLDKTAATRYDLKFYKPCFPTQARVSKKTLARWVKNVSYKVGVHTKAWKTHSIRSASTLNLFSGDLSLTEIGTTAGWTNVKAFGKSNFLLTN